MDELLGTRAQPERWSRSGSLCAEVGNRGTDGTISDVYVISIAWLLMIGDFQSRGDFPFVPRHREVKDPGSNNEPLAPGLGRLDGRASFAVCSAASNRLPFYPGCWR